MKRTRLIFGSAFFALMLVYCVAVIYVRLNRPGSDAGWHGTGTSYGEFHIDKINPKGPAKELRVGDKIIAINGVKVAEQPGVLDSDSKIPPGSRYSMTVQRDGQEMTFTWQTVPWPRGQFEWKELIPLLYWLSGLCVLLLKAEDRQAWLLALMLGSFSGLLGFVSPDDMPNVWLRLLIALARITGLFSFLLPLHLFLFFPQPSPLLRHWPHLTRWMYVTFCLFVLPTFGSYRLPLDWSKPFFSWPPVGWLMTHGFVLVGYLALLAYLFGAIFCLWLGYRTADVAGRRRLRVVMWGSLLGFGSLFLVLVMEATNTRERFNTVWDWLQLATDYTLPLVPLSFVYAIVRHRVIPISLMLRRSARYLLVSRGSVLLEGLIVASTVTALLMRLFKHLRPSGLTVGLVSAATAIVAWQLERWLHERYLAPVIDRMFFRQAYDAQHILTELAESLRTTTDTQQLLESVADKIQAALQTERVVIFLRDGQTGDYRGAYACQYISTDACHHGSTGGQVVRSEYAGRLPHYAATLAQLTATGRPLELDGDEPEFDLASANGHSRLTTSERQTLVEAKATLLLPLRTKDAMPGVIALGARLGDLPFSGEDKRLLQSVAASASLALENAQLLERMLSEARRRQEIEAENELRAKELEEARQLQLSMLPKAVPQLPHLEIAALMQTATEVGGDYYDFHLSGDGTLTIAVGDATGHGLKAGTVVTATKSLFNHLAEQRDVAGTLHDASRALKQMNLRSLFMALTLVKVQGDQLHCSVAGMPPILIYRAATQTIEEVPLRGAPLGGLASYAYRQAQLTLAPDDVVLLMSDGLPERFNPASELFEYERTKAALSAHAHAAPRAIVEGLLKASEEWAEGSPLNDDLTLVVLKRKVVDFAAA